MTVSYRMDSHEADDHLDKHLGGLDTETVLALESALMTLFQQTQAVVHIHSGRLRESGRTESHTDRNTWTGEIIYGGGASRVDYAFYELRRGGLHNYMALIESSDEVIGVAFRTGLD